MNRMTCREFDEVVHALVRLELLDIVLREEVISHAARCGSCAERMAAARNLAETTESVADSTREQQAPVAVKMAVVAAFRARRRRRVLWQVFEWSTAATVAAMGLFLMWNMHGRTQLPSVPGFKKDVSSQSNRPQQAAVSAQPSELQPDDSSLSANADTEASAVTDATGDTDVSNFVPVPYAADLEPQESGMIVRVQMTPDSLAELGFPVAAVSNEDLIRADVLVGEDGWPRAVRLVQQAVQ